MENANSPEYLEKIKNQLIENLRRTAHVPSVQMQDHPGNFGATMTDEEEAELDDLDEDENKDVRMTERRWDKNIEKTNEFEESDTEEMDQANGVTRNRGPKRFQEYQKSELDDESRAPTPANGTAEDVVKSKEVDEVMQDVEPAAEADAIVAETGGIETQEEQLKEAQKEPAEADKDVDVVMDEPAAAEPAPVAEEAAVKKEEGSPKRDEPSAKVDQPAEETAPATGEAAVIDVSTSAAAVKDNAPATSTATEKARSEPSEKPSEAPKDAPAADETKPTEAPAEDAMDLDEAKTTEAEKVKEKMGSPAKPADEPQNKAEDTSN